MVMKNSKNKLAKYLFLTILVIVIGLFGYKLTKQMLNQKENVFVEMGNIENSKIYTAYLLKEEIVIDIDQSKTSIPILAEGQRVSKNQTIAIYRGSEYINSSDKLAQMDNEILEAMKNLPEIYVSEVQSMDSEIINNIKPLENETSYVKIQDTKVIVNNLLNKRARAVAENSPQGETVRNLIIARNSYEESTKTSKDNIKSTTGGVISYKLDGLESAKTFNNLSAISISDVREKIKDQKISNGVKIVNNYEAYLLLEVKDIDKKYLEVGKENKIRIVGIKDLELDGVIYRVRDLEEGRYEVMYKITNKIEDIANLREIEVEVVWVSNYGIYVPNEYLKIKEDVDYVTVLKYGENIDVPVNIIRKNDKYSIITNIDDRESIKGTWDDYDIRVYDQLVKEDIAIENK